MYKKEDNGAVEIAIIGGTGIYDNDLFREEKTIKSHTPYGPPSDSITVGMFGERKLHFFHDMEKAIESPPHMINYRANIWALKDLGVRRIIAPSAVGSLNYSYAPGEIMLPDQFIDFTKNRNYSFFDGSQACHISMADPFCNDLRRTANKCINDLGIKFHDKGTYVCIEGPRFSTRSESKMFRDIYHADIIGMTLIPECILARESEICYLSISTITDYDVWAEHPVSSKDVIEILQKNADTTRTIISKLMPLISNDRNDCSCGSALDEALL